MRAFLWKSRGGSIATALLVSVVLVSGVASGHELWLETAADGQVRQSHSFEVCWGHGGERASGSTLEAQQDKTSTAVMMPSGDRAVLKTVMATDCFTVAVTPAEPGYYYVGAELQTGIVTRAMHSIPANTRIIMCGKTLTHVPGSEAGLSSVLGHDLELVLLSRPADLKPGAVVRAKVLFRGKPLGGKGVEVSLVTTGPKPLADDAEIQSHAWSVVATPHPETGALAFPLITSGCHYLTIRHLDETPGVYDGDRNDRSEFSHLQKGDAYERTMYVTTLTVQVDAP